MLNLTLELGLAEALDTLLMRPLLLFAATILKDPSVRLPRLSCQRAQAQK